MFDYRRSHTCKELRLSDENTEVTLSGWVHRRRDHGGLIFVDLRDRFGLTQLVFDPHVDAAAHTAAENLRSEWVISVRGRVRPRAEGMANPKLETGEIEVEVKELAILSKAQTPPFSICDEFIEVNEELRLKHRCLDIRRGEIAENLVTRHKLCMAARRCLDSEGFLEIQTPILGRSTPEGARDYLVPSRVHPGSFYALPQSPQIFKQLLMVAGMDRYFQIATCFRDEDLRAERQPEFTQIDIEMSFGFPEDLFEITERLVGEIFKSAAGIELPSRFQRMTYHDCIARYGTDKPDLRFDMPLIDLSDIAGRSDFSVFKDQIANGGMVKGLCVKGGAEISRKGIDEYTSFVGRLGIRGLAWMKVQDGKLSSNIVKFFNEDLQQELMERAQAESGDLLLMVADQAGRTHQALDHLRRKVARERDLIDPKRHECLWVTDFPLFHWNEDENRMESEHHPFTGLHPDDLELMETEPLKVRSSSYDLVINGYECASGSQRIHDGDLQKKIFETLQLSAEEIKSRFGFFVDGLSYGTPPHLGLALGVDRLAMILCGTESIRDVIAFPKTQRATDLMTEAPSEVSNEQLKELSISVDRREFSWS